MIPVTRPAAHQNQLSVSYRIFFETPERTLPFQFTELLLTNHTIAWCRTLKKFSQLLGTAQQFEAAVAIVGYTRMIVFIDSQRRQANSREDALTEWSGRFVRVQPWEHCSDDPKVPGEDSGQEDDYPGSPVSLPQRPQRA